MRTLALLLLIASPCLAQRDSVALIRTPDGIATCVVVVREVASGDGWVGLVATSWHVVADNQKTIHKKFKVEYANGQSCSTGYVVCAEESSDLAVLRMWIPKSSPPLEITDIPEAGDAKLYGYPYGEYGEAGGRFLRKVGDWEVCDIPCQPGFSGGALVINGKLCGIIQGGWFWYQNEDNKKTTWPTRCSSASNLKRLIERNAPVSD